MRSPPFLWTLLRAVLTHSLPSMALPSRHCQIARYTRRWRALTQRCSFELVSRGEGRQYLQPWAGSWTASLQRALPLLMRS